ncbi:hypothetical protein PF005_g13390 [Phytophthora fragariae]|uniref:Uncharacterized protein n=1 Tax=Phytophthora fragariae TaxID=53985 RepID=A0A6A3RYC2_9STRA|nr:hypothetical protein PF003_g14013 [Phytophthora fragariae]KAE8935522.1 hypothetical protein PF009_g14537 [Phytophthora fragariae]KAE9004845.1 hypothetical protein PF011_g12289 [Phytophthora fragariae]KAE9105170.1 hypothetical protein PF010_g13119 [Phytophthora fragariae]KAE9106131.1 hypothetical protein PF007_g13524 [Phytophthora fragariae]
MRTTFTFEDDKELVQLASAYVDAGTHISWAGVVQRMRRADHSARELQQRLRTLMRTWGTDIRRFPPSFCTQVQRDHQRRHASCAKVLRSDNGARSHVARLQHVQRLLRLPHRQHLQRCQKHQHFQQLLRLPDQQQQHRRL